MNEMPLSMINVQGGMNMMNGGGPTGMMNGMNMPPI